MESQTTPEQNARDSVGSPEPQLLARWRRRRGLWAALGVVVVIAVAIRITVAFLPDHSQPEITIVDVAPGAAPEVAAVVDETAKIVDALITRFPDQSDSWHVLASYYHKFGKLNEATGCWQRCLELSPDFAEGHYWFGVTARDKGHNEEAVESFRKALEHASNQPQVSVHLAQTLMDLGKMEEAIEVLEKNLAAFPRSLPSFVLLGDIYVQLKQYEKARKNFETVIAEWPDYTVAYYGLAKACGGLGDTAHAKQYMEKFEELKKQDEEAHRNFLRTGSDLPRVQKKAAEVLVLAGKSYLAHGEVEKAERMLLRALELCPSEPECPQVLAWLYERQGRIDQALEALEQGCKANPEDVGVHLRLGEFQAKRGRFDAAEESLNEAIRLLPYQGGGYVALAKLHLTSNRKLPEAKELAAKAVELEPLAENYYLLGVICQRVGDLESARAAIEQAVALEPDNPEYRQVQELVLHQIENDG